MPACHERIHNHVERLAKEKIDKLLANIEKGLSAKVYEFSLEEIDEKLSMLQRELMTLVRLKRAKSTRTIPVVICFNTLFLRSH